MLPDLVGLLQSPVHQHFVRILGAGVAVIGMQQLERRETMPDVAGKELR